MSKLAISLLGAFHVTRQGTTLTNFKYDAARALLAYLAFTPDTPHRREALAGLLWPDEPDATALTYLRRVLHQLRTVLGDHEAEAPLLLVTRTSIQMQGTRAEIDVSRLRNVIAACHAHPHTALEQCPDCIAKLRQAVDLYRGEFLQGFFLQQSNAFEEWLLFSREYLHRQMVEILHALTVYYQEAGKYEQMYVFAQRLLALEPWRESTHRQLMIALASSGQRTAALAQYESCRQILARELNVEPDPETVALYERIRAGGLARAPSDSLAAPSFDRPSSAPQQEWGDVPEVPLLHGRQAELAHLTQWLVADGCRLVTILGMGGAGKSALAARLTRDVGSRFQRVIWQSLLNAPPLDEILRTWLHSLSGQQLATLPESLEARLALLFTFLRDQRALLILDNVESILEGGDSAGNYRRGYEVYGQLIQRMGESEHRSCLLLTSRERPRDTSRLERDSRCVRSLLLAGLEREAGQQILAEQGVLVPSESGAALVARYSGNPLALKLVADTISEIFNGDVTAFLGEETAIFDDIQEVLAQQFARLSNLERDIVVWLAIEREPVSFQVIDQNLVQSVSRSELLGAVRSLQRRSLLEQVQSRRGEGAGDATGFTLQNVVTEYLTERLVAETYREILDGQVNCLNRYALLKVQAREYVRRSQLRLILAMLAERLRTELGSVGVAERLKRLLHKLQTERPLGPGYAAGNILNLLLYLGIDVGGWDFSRLSVWQAYLRGISLPNVDFSHANLKDVVFTDAFSVIVSLGFSPDGRLLAAGTGDGQVRLWQTADGQLYQSFSAPTNWVYGVVFSPDGRLLASASEDAVVRVWEMQQGQLLRTLQGHVRGVYAIAMSPDGKNLASGGEDCDLRLWNVDNGDCLRILPGHTHRIFSVAFSPDGRRVASSSADGTARIWRVDNGDAPLVLRGHAGTVYCVAFSPDRRTVATASEDATVRLWNVQSGELRYILHGHEKGVFEVAFSADGLTLATSSEDQTVRLWDLQTEATHHILTGHTQGIDSLAFSADGALLATGGGDRTVRLWNPRNGQALQTLQGHTCWIRAIAWLPDPTTGERIGLISGGEDLAISVWDLKADSVRQTWQGHTRRIWCLAVSPDGRTVASGAEDQTIRLWDAASGRSLHMLAGQIRRTWSVAFSPNSKTVATGSDEPLIRLWDVDSGQEIEALEGHTNWVLSVVFSPDGTLLASGSADQTVCIWDLQKRQVRHRMHGHSGRVWSVALDPHGTLLASGAEDQTVRLWDVMNGDLVATLAGHTGQVATIDFHSGGALLASGGEDQTVRLWDVQSGQTLHVLQGHTQAVQQLAFSPDGSLLATCSYDETIRFWDVQTGICVKILQAEGPYLGMNITAVTGLTDAQRAVLKTLGAIEDIGTSIAAIPSIV
jgi:WD40 repeat protein/DNA-binding SARP family transcriptional activator